MWECFVQVKNERLQGKLLPGMEIMMLDGIELKGMGLADVEKRIRDVKEAQGPTGPMVVMARLMKAMENCAEGDERPRVQLVIDGMQREMRDLVQQMVLLQTESKEAVAAVQRERQAEKAEYESKISYLEALLARREQEMCAVGEDSSSARNVLCQQLTDRDAELSALKARVVEEIETKEELQTLNAEIEAMKTALETELSALKTTAEFQETQIRELHETKVTMQQLLDELETQLRAQTEQSALAVVDLQQQLEASSTLLQRPVDVEHDFESAGPMGLKLTQDEGSLRVSIKEVCC